MRNETTIDREMDGKKRTIATGTVSVFVHSPDKIFSQSLQMNTK